jgi:hypothetical protein
MTKDDAHLYIPLIEALRDGELQTRTETGAWRDCDSCAFIQTPDNYRRKPKPREFLAVMELDGSGMLYRDKEQMKYSWNCGRPTIRVREVID